MSLVGPTPSRAQFSGYPTSWEFDGLLTSGEPVHLRPMLQSDISGLAALAWAAEDLSRSFDAGSLTNDAPHGTEVIEGSQVAFVLLAGTDPVAFGGYHRSGPGGQSAEFVLVVADSFRHRGAATLLLEALSAHARTKGVWQFVAETRDESPAMLEVLEDTGLRCVSSAESGVVRVEIDLRPTPDYRSRCDEREATAEAASIAAILRPRSVAVVGAGRHPGSVGHEVVRSLLAGDYSGCVYPINPSARSICGVPAFPSLLSLPERIDLAIIAVPPTDVPDVLEEAGALGVRATIVITAGFGETGRSGVQVEAELLATARRHGMRIVGPNCLGVVNTDPEIRMNATFAGLEPLPGSLALVSQSGAVGIVLVEQARTSGIGLSSFVSVGNSLDVSANDLLCYFERDERTAVVALYLESLGNPRKFARIARRVGASKPIVALKAGVTPAGARGARSHTAAAATPQVVVSALLQGAGVIKVERLEELFDVSSLLGATPLPAGNRVALVGNSGGPLILAADACEGGGLAVPELDQATRAALREVVTPTAAVGNPVDLTADGTASVLGDALELVLGDDAVDVVIVVTTELIALPAQAAREVVGRVAQSSKKPIVACILGSAPALAAAPDTSQGVAVAQLPSPERAAAAVAHVCSYAEWRRRPRPAARASWESFDEVAVHEIVASTLARSAQGGWLDLDQAARLVEKCGVPAVPTRAAASADEAVAIAESMGYPVALKVRSGELVHKSEAGGVALGLEGSDSVRDAYEAMARRLGPQMDGVVLQPMVAPGLEAIVGLASDPVFGPVVMVGLGGVMTELLGDRAFAVPPLDAGAADALVASLRAAPLLGGYRGAPLVDRAALVGALEMIAHVAEEVPELVELDLNPLLVNSAGVLAVDCKARLAPQGGGPGPLFRALPPDRR